MVMRTLSRLTVVLTLASIPAAVRAQGVQLEPWMQPLFTSDSISVDAQVALSRDGQWIVFTRDEGNLGASLWLARVGTNRATRLTSAGYEDRFPMWLPKEDAVLFVSNRASRGMESRYIMRLGVDTVTGGAVGAPRQVSTDASEGAVLPYEVSPDGKSLLYSADGGKTLRIIPVVGGPSRVLVTAGTAPITGDPVGMPRIIAPVWSRDSRSIYYNEHVGDHRLIRRTPVDGGPAVTLATIPLDSSIVPYGADPTMTLHGLSRSYIGRLVDASGRAVGPGYATPRPLNWWFFGRGDMRGVTGVSSADGAFEIRLRPVSGGAARTVRTNRKYWSDGMTPEGNIIVDYRDATGPAAALLDTAGHVIHSAALPSDATAQAWDGSVGNLLTFRRGPASIEGTPVFAIDLMTGQTRQISARAFNGPNGTRRYMKISAPGGSQMDQDAFYLAEPAGAGVQFRRITPSGDSRVLLARPNLAATVLATDGEHVAWCETVDRGVSIFYAQSADAAPQLLYHAAPSTGRDVSIRELVFSHDGHTIAALLRRQGKAESSTSFVFLHPATPNAAPQILPSNLRDAYELHWTKDDAGLVAIGESVPAAGAATRYVAVLRPIDASRPLETLTPDEAPIYESLEMSHDGRYLVYPINIPARNVIWTARFDVPGPGKR
jgi:hypothetical protein